MGTLNVISLVGPSGAGKSTALKALERTYPVLPERYMELNRHKLSNKLVTSKWAYIQYWFDAVLQAKHDLSSTLITDRCPLDTCAYVDQGQEDLLAAIKFSIDELNALDIKFKPILMTAPFHFLQERIRIRLKNEPERLRYNEWDASFNQRAYDFYYAHMGLWSEVIDVSLIPDNSSAEHILTRLDR